MRSRMSEGRVRVTRARVVEQRDDRRRGVRGQRDVGVENDRGVKCIDCGFKRRELRVRQSQPCVQARTLRIAERLCQGGIVEQLLEHGEGLLEARIAVERCAARGLFLDRRGQQQEEHADRHCAECSSERQVRVLIPRASGRTAIMTADESRGARFRDGTLMVSLARGRRSPGSNRPVAGLSMLDGC